MTSGGESEPNTERAAPGEPGYAPPSGYGEPPAYVRLPPGHGEPPAYAAPPPSPPPGYGEPPGYGTAPGYTGPPASGPPATGQAAYGQAPHGQAPYGQAPYGQAPYGQAPYGQPAGYTGYGPPPASSPYTGGTAAAPGIGVVGITVAVVGAALGVLAFTVLNWFDGTGASHFGNVHDVMKLIHAAGADNAVSYYYFNWLAWVLLGAAVLVAVIANLPTPNPTPIKIAGAVLGLAGIAMTFVAIELVRNSRSDATGVPNGYSEYLKHARWAFYFAVAAFLLTTIASLVGPRRRITTGSR